MSGLKLKQGMLGRTDKGLAARALVLNKYGSVQELRSTFGHLNLLKDLLEFGLVLIGLVGFSLVWLVLVWLVLVWFGWF